MEYVTELFSGSPLFTLCFRDGSVSGSVEALQPSPETRRAVFAVWHRRIPDQRQAPGSHHVQDGAAGIPAL